MQNRQPFQLIFQPQPRLARALECCLVTINGNMSGTMCLPGMDQLFLQLSVNNTKSLLYFTTSNGSNRKYAIEIISPFRPSVILAPTQLKRYYNVGSNVTFKVTEYFVEYNF